MSDFEKSENRRRSPIPLEVNIGQLVLEAWSLVENDPVDAREYSGLYTPREWWFAAALSAENTTGETYTFTGVHRFQCPEPIDIEAFYDTADPGCIRARQQLAFTLEAEGRLHLKKAVENALQDAQKSGFNRGIALAATCPIEFSELMAKTLPSYSERFAAVAYALLPNQIIPVKGLENQLQ